MLCEAVSAGVGPAHAVAEVAHGEVVRSGGGIEDRLAPLTGEGSRATRGDQRHVAGMEVGAEGRHDARGSDTGRGRARTARGRRVRRAVRVHIERAIFLDDPAIVGDVGRRDRRVGFRSQNVFAVQNRHAETRGWEEGHGYGRAGAADRALRVLRVVGEVDRATGGDRARRRRTESPIGVHRQGRETRSRHARGVHGQRIARPVLVKGQDAGRLDLEERPVRGVRGAVHGDAAARLERRRTEVHQSAGRARGCSISAIREAGRRACGIGKRTVRIQGQSCRGGAYNVGSEDIDVVGEQALAGIQHGERLAGEHGVVGIRIGGRGCCSDRGHGAIGADVSEHSGVACHRITRQAQLPVEDRKRRRACGRNVNHHVLGLARGHEHFALHARQARQNVAVLGDQREAGNRSGAAGLRADDRRHVHPQAGVHQAHQNRAAGGHRGRRRRVHRSGRRGLVESAAVDQIIQRRVVDGRWIAGLESRIRVAVGKNRIAAAAVQTRPHLGLAESRRPDRGLDRRVLDRIDFAQQQRNVGVVGHRRGGPDGRIRRRRRCGGRIGHHQDPIQAHRALDRRVCAGLDQVGAGFQRWPASAANSPAQGGRRAHRHFGGERLHASALNRRRPDASQRCARRIPRDRPGQWLRVAVIRARGRSRRRPESAAQLAHDHQRRGDVAPGERKAVRQGDRQILPRGDRDHDRRPLASRCRRGIQRSAGRGRGGRCAGVTPHRHGRAIRQ